MNPQQTWLTQFKGTKEYTLLKQKPLAYFCIEYALSDLLPTYAGGLGVLAGDYVRELADQEAPAVAVGLYYQSKYGARFEKEENIQQPALTREQQGLKPVLDNEKKPLLIPIPLIDHTMYVRAWMFPNKGVPVYLLDTDVPENTPEDKIIGYTLYDANKETRLKQEMVLGIGGFRLLEKLNVQPSIYHMNEGHSALLMLEIIRHEMQKRKIAFHEAVKLANHHVVFTNHTLLAAGNEIYNHDLFSLLIETYASELQVPVSDILALGTVAESKTFSLSLFALRLAGKSNGVSKLHGQEAAKVWSDFPIEYVTNGVHLPTWDSVPQGQSVAAAHQENKKKLVAFINQQTKQQWTENILLIGWARRMVPYKRPLAIFDELQSFIALAKDAQKPIHIVMAGIAHQEDAPGKEMIQKLQTWMSKELQGVVVYLDNYNCTMAKLLTSGCDIWLNTPVVGSEACGTSGMKAALNGTLPLTTKDGWIDEVDLTGKGWLIDSDHVNQSVLSMLSKQVIPSYYGTDHTSWNTSMQNARQLIQDQFSTTRMLKDYIERVYLPILTQSYQHYFGS
jgi:glucan phosphorylase